MTMGAREKGATRCGAAKRLFALALLAITGCWTMIGQSRSQATYEVETLTIGRSGIHPPSITRPVGPFLLVVYNHTASKSLKVKIKRKDGSDIKDGYLDDKGGKWDDYLDLTAGTYEVSVPGSGKQACILTITSR